MIRLVLMICVCSSIITAEAQKGFSFNSKGNILEVLYKGNLLTAYGVYDSSKKPVLFPVNTVDGVTVTRGYPFAPRSGDRTDHPHHTGIWLNYEAVNGLDFWNNSTAIEPARRHLYGTIVSKGVQTKKTNKDDAHFTATASWNRPDGKTLLNEDSKYDFQVKGNDFIIDRTTTLTATDTTVLFRDVKDGLLAIRVARELELPSKESSSFIDDKGNVTTVPASGNEVTGMYYSSNGLKGDSVWSTKGEWVMLSGRKDGKEITVAIFDNPANPGYPAYWHARGYGLFSVNPLGRKIFSNGKETLNLTLAPGKSVTFKYRIVIHSGVMLTATELNSYKKF